MYMTTVITACNKGIPTNSVRVYENCLSIPEIRAATEKYDGITDEIPTVTKDGDGFKATFKEGDLSYHVQYVEVIRKIGTRYLPSDHEKK